MVAGSLWLHLSPDLWSTPGKGVPMMVIMATLISYADMRLVVSRVCRFNGSSYYVLTFGLIPGLVNAYLGGLVFLIFFLIFM